MRGRGLREFTQESTRWVAVSLEKCGKENPESRENKNSLSDYEFGATKSENLRSAKFENVRSTETDYAPSDF